MATDTPDHAKAIELLRQGTPGPWFVHDFRGASESPSVQDITVSCDHPATITVCSMDRALTATDEEALANARRIAANPDLVECFAAADAMLKAFSGSFARTVEQRTTFDALDTAIAKVCKGVLGDV